MGVIEISDGLHSAPETIKLGRDLHGMAALGMWIDALTWMHRARPTWAYLPADALDEIGGNRELADLLVKAGLWEEIEPGAYFVATHTRRGRPLWRYRANEHRPHIPDAIRAAVMERDGYACRHCGATEDLALDHVYPYSLGGEDTVENLQVLCRACNSKKGATV